MSRVVPKSNLPNGFSSEYWSTWTPSRKGASVSESIDRDIGEEWIGGWDGIGLYEGNNKVPSYQTLSVHLTNHRLIIIPEETTSSSSNSSTASPLSLQTHLSHIRQTEFYAGFMRSSAKITLTLGPQPPSPSNDLASAVTSNSHPNSTEVSVNSGWTCNICGFVNPLSGNRASPIAGAKCGLCGIPYSTSQLSVSASPSRTNTPTPVQKSTITSSNSNTNVIPTNGNSGDISANEDGLISCPACTFLNSPLLPNCEICSTSLPRKPKPSSSIPNSNTTKSGIESVGKTEIVKLSFRKGGENEVYKKLKAVLGDKAWERGLVSIDRPITGNGEGIDGLPRSGAGIDGILQQISLTSQSQSNNISEAFADLEVLMLRAGEMVKIAQSINSKLTNQLNTNTNDGINKPSEEETTMIRNTLVQLGLNSPAITKEMIKDENKYFEGLAKELGELLTGTQREKGERKGLMIGDGYGKRQVIALDEVWGLWMRARGVSLLPPSTLISILPLLPYHTTPSITNLTLPSTLQVLHTPNYSINAILSRTLDRLNPSPIEDEFVEGREVEEKSFTILEFSSFENLPIGLSKEFIDSLEKIPNGLVKDEQSNLIQGRTRWYRDIISDWSVEDI